MLAPVEVQAVDAVADLLGKAAHGGDERRDAAGEALGGHQALGLPDDRRHGREVDAREALGQLVVARTRRGT